MTYPPYDRERAKLYKKWWARQRGAPQGELVRVPKESWERQGEDLAEQDTGRKEVQKAS